MGCIVNGRTAAVPAHFSAFVRHEQVLLACEAVVKAKSGCRSAGWRRPRRLRSLHRDAKETMNFRVPGHRHQQCTKKTHQRHRGILYAVLLRSFRVSNANSRRYLARKQVGIRQNETRIPFPNLTLDFNQTILEPIRGHGNARIIERLDRNPSQTNLKRNQKKSLIN